MLNNFQLTAIVSKGTKDTQMDLLHIPLFRELQTNLTEDWSSQYDTFVSEIQEIDFDPGYKLEKHECFCVRGYKLPDSLATESSLTISDLEMLGNNETQIKLIRGIAGFARNEDSEELILFQNFKPSQVIRRYRSLLLQGNAYDNIRHPVLTLGGKLSAVYQPKERKLLFDNFRNVNTFLPLSDFYKEASEQDIREALHHEKLAPENTDALAIGASQWFRTRFTMLKHSRVLDDFDVLDIQSRSSGYEVSIQLTADNKKIVFPANKSAAKKLLQFLNEEIYRGAITDTLYETNSKKEAD